MKRNIIWIIVDSVRNYACPADRIDDRCRISLMDELAETWIDFRTVVTSAPSTVMSVSAMLTSCPSYYLGASFVGFNLSHYNKPTIGSILKDNGYKTYFSTLLPNEREAWDDICDHIPRRLWPRGLTHRMEWSNPTITEVVKNVVADGLKEPFFYYVHYNCRGDEQVSENVRNGLKAFEDGGFLENAVVFLTSDHGYPDPFRLDEVRKLGNQKAFKHRRLPHDLVLTDDNILVPLLVKYPGCTPKRIEDQVCTLDYLPTTLELAGIKNYDSSHFYGKSIVPLIENKEMPELSSRKIRIDGRFLGQPGRCTAIRSATRKYIYYHDLPENQREQFYDLTKDSLEVKNILKAGVVGYETDLQEFRRAYEKEEEYGFAIQRDSIAKKYIDELKNRVGPRSEYSDMRVLYLRSNAWGFDKVFEGALRQIHGETNVHCLDISEVEKVLNEDYDLVLGLILGGGQTKKVFAILSRIKSNRKFLIDLSINIIPHSRIYMFYRFLNDFRSMRKYYLREPLYLWDKICYVVRPRLFGHKKVVKATDYDQVNVKPK